MERMVIVVVRKEPGSVKSYLEPSLRGGRRMGVEARVHIISRCTVYLGFAGWAGLGWAGGQVFGAVGGA